MQDGGRRPLSGLGIVCVQNVCPLHEEQVVGEQFVVFVCGGVNSLNINFL